MNSLLKDYILEAAHPDDLIPKEVKEVIREIKNILHMQNVPDSVWRKKASYTKFGSGSSALVINKIPKGDPRKKEIKDWYAENKVKGLTIEFRE